MASFCESCGASLSDIAKFCNACGQAIGSSALSASKKRSKPLTITGAVILVLGTLLLAYSILARDIIAVPIGKMGLLSLVVMLIGFIIMIASRKKVKSVPNAEPRNATASKTALARNEGNGAYVAWFLFYFLFFSVITVGIAIPFFIITVIIAFSKVAEKLWRSVSGIRPLRLKSEKDRLAPLFMEVYEKAVEADTNLSKGIKLYIKEDMTVNAFAFGRETLILTRGCLELLNDECLKGLIAHEFGHFSHGDTEAILLSSVSNFFMSFMIRKLTDRKNYYDTENKGGIIAGIVKLIYYLFRTIDFIGELILKRTSRRNEYLADEFADKSGFGEDLTKVLIEIYSMSISKPQSVKEQLKSSHPDITLRIERLEEALYS